MNTGEVDIIGSSEQLIAAIFDDDSMENTLSDRIIKLCRSGEPYIAFDVQYDNDASTLLVDCINICSTHMENRSTYESLSWWGMAIKGRHIETIRCSGIPISYDLAQNLKEQFYYGSKETLFFIECINARIL